MFYRNFTFFCFLFGFSFTSNAALEDEIFSNTSSSRVSLINSKESNVNFSDLDKIRSLLDTFPEKSIKVYGIFPMLYFGRTAVDGLTGYRWRIGFFGAVGIEGEKYFKLPRYPNLEITLSCTAASLAGMANGLGCSSGTSYDFSKGGWFLRVELGGYLVFSGVQKQPPQTFFTPNLMIGWRN